MERENICEWYDHNRARYVDMVESVEKLLKTLLTVNNIPYYNISGRVKDKESCVEKFKRKAYSSYEQLMDLAALRIITQTTAETKFVCPLIAKEFTVDWENSGDKSDSMEIDKVGYLSIHYVVSFSSSRLDLPEYAKFKGLCCEIQVRSLLQHTWAEIAHDRSYKFSGVLPNEIQRRFYLIAGTLELMDQEFCVLIDEINQYAERVKKLAEKGNVENISIDSISLLQLMNTFFKDYNPKDYYKNFWDNSSVIIEELSDFGIKDLQQIQQMLGQKKAVEWIPPNGHTYIGILREAMILKDPEKYFKNAWKQHWRYMGAPVLDAWKNLGIRLDEVKKYIDIRPQENNMFLLCYTNTTS